jgi:hypothetical protein
MARAILIDHGSEDTNPNQPLRFRIALPGAITREGFSMLSPQLTAAIAAVLLAATLVTAALVITGAQSELTPQQRVDEAFRVLGTR